jgi:Thermostable 8-oxoguanine DNA glycosylase
MQLTQKVFFEFSNRLIQIDLPPAKEEVMPSVEWGDASGFPTIAFWLYKVLERRISGELIRYKLGNSLLEEVGACILGGHGIPASHGLAAYNHMKGKGAFDGKTHSEEQLSVWLSEPIPLNGKTFKYRFARQKSKYLSSALQKVIGESPSYESGQDFRNWLLGINGVGLKTASWITRNWLDADDVAILDIHIYRAGLLGGFFSKDMTVERNYLDLEDRFINLAKSMGIRTSELDAVMWFEMQSSSSVHRLLSTGQGHRSSISKASSHDSRSDTHQLSII